jgi:acyl-CoA synthetase (AMP-forming)/AMP-acid ligase II
MAAMHLGDVATRAPERPAVIMGGSGEVTTFRELDERSNQLAHLFRQLGIGPGGSVAVMMENHPRYLEVLWAAQRSGLYYTAVNSHLSSHEAGYIVGNCGAELLVGSHRLAGILGELDPADTPDLRARLMLDGEIPGWDSYEKAVAGQPGDPIDDECEGDFMLYSSGTTGLPKGIRRELTLAPMGQVRPAALGLMSLLGIGDGNVYLCPAPLYHAAPLAWSMGAQRMGATVVVMERFDPAQMLRLIERYHVTHAQLVPTMFVRMLKLPPEERAAADVSSLIAVVHAAAPCPVEVKREMIEWWGPIIYEYYASTEGVGATWITSDDWLAHPGSVGRVVMGEPHILDEAGNSLPAGDIGTIWFSGGSDFTYHRDPDKTAEARDELGRATVGDVGYIDEEGYLYLTDRRSFMIISGGVNIYPQEAENVLIGHPKVMDVAVIGVPNPDLGEEVKAVVQPIDWADTGDELAEELMQYCRDRLSPFKCPRSVDFERELPRLDSGKLYKRLLRDRYWSS